MINSKLSIYDLESEILYKLDESTFWKFDTSSDYQ